MNTNEEKINGMSIKEINEFVISELKLTTLARYAKDNINNCRYMDWKIEPEILQLIQRLELWKRWGHDDLFFALRGEAGLSVEETKEAIKIAKQNKYE